MGRQRTVWMAMMTVILWGCASKPNPPDNLLSKEEMTAILLEVHVLESKVSRRSVNRDSLQLMYDHFEGMLFEEMDVDTAAYNASIRFYIANPDLLAEIYEAVVDSLQLRSKNRIPED